MMKKVIGKMMKKILMMLKDSMRMMKKSMMTSKTKKKRKKKNLPRKERLLPTRRVKKNLKRKESKLLLKKRTIRITREESKFFQFSKFIFNPIARAPIEEEEEDEEEVELPEDWEEQLLDEDLIDEMIEEEGDDELAMLNNAIMQGNGTVAGYPPYMFQTPKQQRKFFEKLNTDYYVKLEAAQKRKLEHSRKVNFQLTKNTVKGNSLFNKISLKSYL